MPVTIISTLQRGGQGDAPFPISKESDVQVSYMTVATIADRNSIPEWQRVADMRVYVIEDGTDYRLGVDVTIVGQSWTVISGPTLYQQLSQKNQPGGYVGLEVDGFIDPIYIKNIYSSNAYVVATLAERNALATVTGDIVVVTDINKTYVKLNNTSPASNSDFVELTVPVGVTSVNGQIGTVTIDMTSVLAQPNSTTVFNQAVGVAPAVTQNTSQTATNTGDIAAIYALLQGSGVTTGTVIDIYDPGKTYQAGNLALFGSEFSRNLYRVLDGKGPIVGVAPPEPFIWEKVGDFYDKAEVDQLIFDAVNKPFDWGRPIKEPVPTGGIIGGTILPDGIENYFYGFRSGEVVADLISTPIEVGDISASTLTGSLDPKDHEVVDLLEVRNIATDAIENGILFNPPPAITDFSYTTVPLLGIEGVSNSYRFESSLKKVVGDPIDRVVSADVAVYGIYPFLAGTSPDALVQATYYTDLVKTVKNKDNLKFTLSGTDEFIYIMYPDDYPDLISIVDQHEDEILGVTFPDTPVAVTVTSNGLNTDWSKGYKLYKSKTIIDIDSTLQIKFVEGGDAVFLIDLLENDQSLHFTKADKDAIRAASTGASGHVIKNDILFLANRTYLNIKGDGVVVTDDLANDQTVIQIDTGGDLANYLDKITYDPTNQGADVFDMANMAEAAAAKVFTDLERAKLASLTDNFKGVYNTNTDLTTAYPAGAAGWYAQVLQPTPAIWIWDATTVQWANTGAGSTGDMLAALYDPLAVGGNAFAMQNMVEEAGVVGTEYKIFLQSERAKLAGLPVDAYSKAETDALLGYPGGLAILAQTKLANTFTDYEPIYFNGTTWLPAQADAEATLCLGIVFNKAGDDFDVAVEGVFNFPTHNIALPGVKKYLDPANPGTLIDTAPTTDNTFSQVVFEIIDADYIYIRANSSPIIENIPLILR